MGVNATFFAHTLQLNHVIVLDFPFLAKNAYSYIKIQYNNHSSLLSSWNLKMMKDTLRLLSFHLRMLPYAVTFAYPFGSSRGLPRASNLFNRILNLLRLLAIWLCCASSQYTIDSNMLLKCHYNFSCFLFNWLRGRGLISVEEEINWNALPTADKGKPANQDQTPV
jgi:hypothetical protein